jgi:hypothetical protein
MNSADSGNQLMHNGGSLFEQNKSALGYDIMVDNAGTYYLTANHTTWHVDQVSLTTPFIFTFFSPSQRAFHVLPILALIHALPILVLL